MILNKLFASARFILLGLLPQLLFLLVYTPGYSQEKQENVTDANRVTNVKWTTKDEVIIINYDLKGAPDGKYEVKVVMKREGDNSFVAIPRTAEGDIGEGFFAGVGREIQWFYRRDYPQGLQGAGYYFEFQVKTVNQQSKWLYYVAGAAALTGGVLAFIVTRGQDHTPPVLELPTPPARP